MLEIKGTVFENEHVTNGEKWYSYNLSFSSKDKDGKWESVSMPIRFVGGAVPPGNKARISLTRAWIEGFKYKDKKIPGWKCMEYETVESNAAPGFSALTNDDVPF